MKKREDVEDQVVIRPNSHIVNTLLHDCDDEGEIL